MTSIKYYLCFLAMLFMFQSCSIQKMRYSRGWNIGWELRGVKDKKHTPARTRTTRTSPIKTVSVPPHACDSPVTDMVVANPDHSPDSRDTILVFPDIRQVKRTRHLTHPAEHPLQHRSAPGTSHIQGEPVNANATWSLLSAVLGIFLFILGNSSFIIFSADPTTFFIIFLAVLILSILSPILGITGMVQVQRGYGRGFGIAILGFILGLILFLVMLLTILFIASI